MLKSSDSSHAYSHETAGRKFDGKLSAIHTSIFACHVPGVDDLNLIGSVGRCDEFAEAWLHERVVVQHQLGACGIISLQDGLVVISFSFGMLQRTRKVGEEIAEEFESGRGCTVEYTAM